MNKDLMIQSGYGFNVFLFENWLCPFCIKDTAKEIFRDKISKDEFGISGLCQECQDKVFGKDK